MGNAFKFRSPRSFKLACGRVFYVVLKRYQFGAIFSIIINSLGLICGRSASSCTRKKPTELPADKQHKISALSPYKFQNLYAISPLLGLASVSQKFHIDVKFYIVT